MHECLICRKDYDPFMSFGKMPLANGFLTQHQFPHEYFYELRVGFCEACGMVQIVEQPDRAKMFNESYAFFSSTSTHMAAHFEVFAENVIRMCCTDDPDPFVVEIGSNDGIMLKNFAQRGFRHLGIEPSSNVAAEALKKGVNTACHFFDENLAEDIVAEYGKASAILAANVMCHIPYLHSVLAGFKFLLKPKGLIVFEDPYLGDILKKISYDQIYDEHAFYFSVTSVSKLFARYDLEVIDAIPQDVHGGSMRYIIAHKGEYPVASSVLVYRTREWELGFQKPETYHDFRRNIEQSRVKLVELLSTLKKQGKCIFGYGATSKSTTIINYCSITSALVDAIYDTTPIKQGKFSPGSHIPIRPYSEFVADYPEYALLFAWNHKKEIMEKEREFRKTGGKWILYVPQVGIY